jgi:hypothetical protein
MGGWPALSGEVKKKRTSKNVVNKTTKHVGKDSHNGRTGPW